MKLGDDFRRSYFIGTTNGWSEGQQLSKADQQDEAPQSFEGHDDQQDPIKKKRISCLARHPAAIRNGLATDMVPPLAGKAMFAYSRYQRLPAALMLGALTIGTGAHPLGILVCPPSRAAARRARHAAQRLV
jgi:hypothetical protein